MAQSKMIIVGDNIRLSIQIATPNITTPNTALVEYNQTPAYGKNLPAEAPNSNNGTPIPMPMANKAAPPNKALPL